MSSGVNLKNQTATCEHSHAVQVTFVKAHRRHLKYLCRVFIHNVLIHYVIIILFVLLLL